MTRMCMFPRAVLGFVLCSAALSLTPNAVVAAPIPMQPTSWAPTGSVNFTLLGFSVATAGDVNGDGRSDVIVGTPYLGNGTVHAYYGAVTPPLDTPPDWTVTGAAGTGFGWSVGPAGDVNGDGYDDVIIGGPNGSGQAYVYHGSQTGLEPTPAWSRTNSAGSSYGQSVATAGDINGDGYSDVLVGAPNWGGALGDLGRAYLYLGGASGLATSSAWSTTGTNSSDLGYSVSTAGDVNADGFDDFLIGDPGYDAGAVSQNNGRVQLYYGNATATPTLSAWSLVGPAAGAQYGRVVSPAGDVDRDGYADAMMASPLYLSSAGRMVFLWGTPTGFSTGATITGAAGSGYGTSIAPAGDLDGDGYADIVVGAPFEGAATEGRVYVYTGNPIRLISAPAWTLEGTQSGANLGSSVGTAGDVDADGFADLLIGEDFYDAGAISNAGRVHLFRGASVGIGVAPIWSNLGDQGDEYYGMALANAGDVNADGFEDLLVGSPRFDGTAGAESGRVELIYGSASGPDAVGTPPWNLEGDAAGDGFGSAVFSAGDINRDGFDDFLVGIPGCDSRGTDAGEVRLYYGGVSGPSPVPAWASDVGSAGDSIGTAIASAGDVNGDGWMDVIIGSGAYGTSGGVFCYLGTPGGLSPTPAWTALGTQAGSRFGFSVGSADRDGDGYSDVFVGVPGWDGASMDEGRVLGYRGGPAGLENTPNWDWVGTTIAFATSATGIQLGHAVCGVANPGGGPDGVAFSAPWYAPPSSSPRGIVWFDFDDGGPDATISAVPGGLLGWSIADAGDCNGDGRGDVVIGSPGGSPSGGWGVHSVADYQEWWTAQSYPMGGYAVAGGDFDGDGLADAAGTSIEWSTGGGNHVGLVAVRPSGSSPYRTPHAPEIRNGAGVRVSRLGVTDEEDAIHLHLDRAQSPAGRTRVRHEWWVYPTADAPTPDQFIVSGSGTWTDTGPRVAGIGSATPLLDDVLGLSPSTLYSVQWRLRSKSPFFPFSRWFRVSNAGRNQGHFRTATSVLAVAEPQGTPGLAPVAAPNPFRGGTRLTFALPSRGDVAARILDTGGRLIRTLDRRGAEPGPQEMYWDGRTDNGEMARPGVYFLRVTSGSYRLGGRIVLMR